MTTSKRLLGKGPNNKKKLTTTRSGEIDLAFKTIGAVNIQHLFKEFI
jgi:hypothetical protein